MMTTLLQPEQEVSAPNSPLKWIGALVILWTILIVVLPSSLSLTNEKLAWYLTRASGTVAYLLMSASMIWGLLLSSKLTNKLIMPAVSLATHNYLSWLAIGLTGFHALILLADNYYAYTLPDLLIPFTGPYNPLWVGAGIIGFYIMLLTSLSFYVKKWIGQKAWRSLHYLTFLAYILTTLHGWMAGSDSALLGSMFLVSGVSVLFLTVYRILSRS